MQFAKKLLKYSIVVDAVIVLAAVIARFVLRSEGDEYSDEFSRIAIMRGERFASRAVSLRRVTVVAVMGSVELDLTNAHLAPGARITVFTLWGGVEVRIPAKWKVVGDTGAFLGDTRMALEGQADLLSDAPALAVNARSIMGGTMVTNQAKTPVG